MDIIIDFAGQIFCGVIANMISRLASASFTPEKLSEQLPDISNEDAERVAQIVSQLPEGQRHYIDIENHLSSSEDFTSIIQRTAKKTTTLSGPWRGIHLTWHPDFPSIALSRHMCELKFTKKDKSEISIEGSMVDEIAIGGYVRKYNYTVCGSLKDERLILESFAVYGLHKFYKIETYVRPKWDSLVLAGRIEGDSHSLFGALPCHDIILRVGDKTPDWRFLKRVNELARSGNRHVDGLVESFAWPEKSHNDSIP